MMDIKLIKALEPIEEEFEVDLFTFDEALDFYKSDIEEYKTFVNQIIKTTRQGRKDEELNTDESCYIRGLKDSLEAVDLIFGGRVEEGF